MTSPEEMTKNMRAKQAREHKSQAVKVSAALDLVYAARNDLLSADSALIEDPLTFSEGIDVNLRIDNAKAYLQQALDALK